MSDALSYTTIDRILAKINRDYRGTKLNEGDIIEWIGEALDFMKAPEVLEEVVSFLQVKDYHCSLPQHLYMITQIARYCGEYPINKCEAEKECDIECEDKKEETIEHEDKDCHFDCEADFAKGFLDLCYDHPMNQQGYPVPLDCNGIPIGDYEVSYYRPSFDLYWEYELWTNSPVYKANFTPVRLSNNTFFNSVVCREVDEKSIYKNCTDEYTIVGTTNRKVRFSFREGFVAISYLRQAIDPETGYPLIPDNPSVIQAISYYIRWKLAEWYHWNGQYGHSTIVQQSYQQWAHYVKQANSFFKMPKSLDEYQNLMEGSSYLIPRRDRYYTFFSSLGRKEVLAKKRNW